MKNRIFRNPTLEDLALPSRRRFVQGLACGGVVAGAGLILPGGLNARTPSSGLMNQMPVLSGTDFDLSIGESIVNYTGASRPAITVNGSLPAPLLRWKEGTTVNLRVSNALPAGSIHGNQTSIHWHGIILPANMDGVPGMSFDGINRGEAYQYRFEVNQSGTYWYHSHSGFQEQGGLYGPIVVEPASPYPFAFDREHVVFLSDWTDMNPAALMRRLKKRSDYDNYSKRSIADFFRDVKRDGLGHVIEDRKAWGDMRMTPTDLSDVNGHTYTFLMNGNTSLSNWFGQFVPGEKVLLRFINGSAMTYFDIRIPGLKMTVVAADGQYVHPVSIDEFRIAAAETFDVIVEPSGQDAFTIFAQDSARTGFVSGTLAVRQGLRAPIPELDRKPLLSMADMGHDHDMSGGDHSGHDMSAPSGDHSGHDMAAASGDHSGHDMSAMAGMISHPETERNNPLVDMQTMSPTPKLDDPGIGLRGNGRDVLTYSRLHSLFEDPDGRAPSRDIELHLTGHMEKFAWSFNGVKFAQAAPRKLNYGERVRIILVNDTMMSHPIHLHGLWSDVEDADGNFMVRKHTVDMPPGSRRSYRVRADALGRWAYHCHLFYHMESGMFREVRVEESA